MKRALLALTIVAALFAVALPAQAGTVTVVAHRGDHDHAPENSLGAYRAAGRDGVSRWETDIRFTRDGVAVLMHDANVRRTTDCAGLVAHKTLRHLDRKCRLNGGGRIPTLEAFVKLARQHQAFSQVEFKTVPTAKQRRGVLALIGPRTTMISFYPQALRKLGSTKTCLLLSSTSAPAGASVDCVSVSYYGLTAERVEAFHAAGQRVYAWTPNTSALWSSVTSLGVDGIVTDEADRLTQKAPAA